MAAKAMPAMPAAMRFIVVSSSICDVYVSDLKNGRGPARAAGARPRKRETRDLVQTGCEFSFSRALAGLIREPERQQHVAGRAALTRIARVHEHHAAGNDGAGAVQRAALRFCAVHRRVASCGVDVPEQLSILTRKC